MNGKIPMNKFKQKNIKQLKNNSQLVKRAHCTKLMSSLKTFYLKNRQSQLKSSKLVLILINYSKFTSLKN